MSHAELIAAELKARQSTLALERSLGRLGDVTDRIAKSRWPALAVAAGVVGVFVLLWMQRPGYHRPGDER